MITLKKLGTVTSALEMNTDNYAIETKIFPTNGDNFPFKYTENIQIIAKKLQIKKWQLIPPEPAFYLVAQSTMVISAKTNIQLSIVDMFDYEAYYKWNFQILAVRKKNCMPVVTHPNW